MSEFIGSMSPLARACDDVVPAQPWDVIEAQTSALVPDTGNAMPDVPSSAVRRAAALLRRLAGGEGVAVNLQLVRHVERELEDVATWLMRMVEPGMLMTAAQQAAVDGMRAAMEGDLAAAEEAVQALPAPEAELVYVEMRLLHGPILDIGACKCGRTRQTLFEPAIETYRRRGPQELPPAQCSCGRLVVARKGHVDMPVVKGIIAP